MQQADSQAVLASDATIALHNLLAMLKRNDLLAEGLGNGLRFARRDGITYLGGDLQGEVMQAIADALTVYAGDFHNDESAEATIKRHFEIRKADGRVYGLAPKDEEGFDFIRALMEERQKSFPDMMVVPRDRGFF